MNSKDLRAAVKSGGKIHFSRKGYVHHVIETPQRLMPGKVQVVYRDREVIKEVERVVYRDHPAAAMLDELETVKTKLDERPADPLEISEEPPEAIADLFQSDRPYADQAQALWTKYNELTQKIMMNLATDTERAKHAKLQGELDWIKHHVFEAV